MSQFFIIHPTHPQARLIHQSANILRNGGVVVYPTDSGYALGCVIGNKQGVERIRQIRQLGHEHNFTLLCRDLSKLSFYARVDNPTFRFLKAHTPGAFTFILAATKEVPKRLIHQKRKTIGLRVPSNAITLAILEELDAPLLNVSLIMPNEQLPLADIDEIRQRLNKLVDLIIDGGPCGIDQTTIVDLSGGEPQIIRQGKGEIA